MKRLIIIAALCLMFGGIGAVSSPISVSAQTRQSNSNDKCTKEILYLPTWHKYLEVGEDPVTGDECAVTGPKDAENPNQLDWAKVVSYVAIAVVEALLRIASLVAVAFVILGGFRYITSQGEPENAKSARQTIINALVGLVIAIAAASIVSFVAGRLTS